MKRHLLVALFVLVGLVRLVSTLMLTVGWSSIPFHMFRSYMEPTVLVTACLGTTFSCARLFRWNRRSLSPAETLLGNLNALEIGIAIYLSLTMVGIEVGKIAH